MAPTVQLLLQHLCGHGESGGGIEAFRKQCVATLIPGDVLHIVDETVKYIITRDKTAKKIGILATSGTLRSGVYQDFCTRHGVQAVVPTKEVEDMLMDIIYNKIKTGEKVTLREFLSVIDYMRESGCDYVVLGCTELSVIKNDLNLTRSDVVDSLEVLAKRSIEICGKQSKD